MGSRKQFVDRISVLTSINRRLAVPAASVAADAPARSRHVCILLAVSNPQRAHGLATVAARIAQTWDGHVTVLHIVRPGRLPSPASGTSSENSGPRPAVSIALDVLEQAGVPAAYLVREAEDAGQAIRETASELRSRLIILGWRGEPEADGTYLDATLKAVLEDPLWDVMVVGGRSPASLGRILVPVGIGQHSALALRLATDLVPPPESDGRSIGGQVTALRVVSEETHGLSPRTLRHLQQGPRRYAKDTRLRRKTVVRQDTAQAILDELQAGYDAVIMGTSREALIDRLLFGEIPQQIAAQSNATVMVVRRHTDPLSRLVRRTWHSFVDLLPRMTADERAVVHDEVLHGSRSRVDFFAMIGLAAILAGLGLLLNSPAVIIGAMLVAPLMSAIVGIGLGLIEGDTALIQTAVASTVRAIFLAIGMGVLLGLLVPDASPTSEILSRARPSLLDLAVALASGAAGAYALCRKDIAAALAGVAIAAALVPPLATVGIGIALGRWDVAGGASLLFVTNLLAIAAAGGVVFLLLGFAPPAAEKRKRSTLQRGLFGTAALLIAITVVLGLLTADSIRTARLDQAIQSAVNSEVATIPDTELVQAVTTPGSDGTLRLAVTVRSTRQFSYAEVLDLQKHVAAKLQRPVALLLTVIPAVRLNPLIPPTLTPTLAPRQTPAPTSTATAANLAQPAVIPAAPVLLPTATFTPTPTVTFTPAPFAAATPEPTRMPTAAPSVVPTATATATASPTLVATPSPTPLPRTLAVVAGTGGLGVFLRASPDGPLIGALSDGTPVILLSDRVQAAGHTWAQVEEPRGQTGWVAEEYLSSIAP